MGGGPCLELGGGTAVYTREGCVREFKLGVAGFADFCKALVGGFHEFVYLGVVYRAWGACAGKIVEGFEVGDSGLFWLCCKVDSIVVEDFGVWGDWVEGYYGCEAGGEGDSYDVWVARVVYH